MSVGRFKGGEWRVSDFGEWRVSDFGEWRVSDFGEWRVSDFGEWRVSDFGECLRSAGENFLADVTVGWLMAALSWHNHCSDDGITAVCVVADEGKGRGNMPMYHLRKAPRPGRHGLHSATLRGFRAVHRPVLERLSRGLRERHPTKFLYHGDGPSTLFSRCRPL